jgi:hypothetical protein
LPDGRPSPEIALKEGVHGGTMGSPVLNEWEFSCRMVDLVQRLL